MYYYYYDWTYILVLIGLGLSLWASHNVNGLIRQYRKVNSSTGLTAAEAAKHILNDNGIYDVSVRMISGAASDYYSPANKEVCLLSENYNSTSIASIGIAAHECGHAIQDATGYFPLTLQRSLAPVCSFASNAGIYAVIIGLFISSTPLLNIGIILFSLGVAFSVLLLPIEYNASNRALRILEGERLMQGEDLAAAKKVLRAAGLTYVAAATASILQLLRLLMLARGRRDR